RYKRRKCEDAEESKNGSKQKRVDRGEPGGWAGGFAKDFAEAMALSEGAGDVTRFVFEGNGGEHFVWDVVLAIPDECDASDECTGGNEPDGGEKEREFAKHHWKNYRRDGV